MAICILHVYVSAVYDNVVPVKVLVACMRDSGGWLCLYRACVRAHRACTLSLTVGWTWGQGTAR